MAACPWCEKPLDRNDAPCPACRRDPRHHPSFGGHGSIDLDLGIAPAPRSSPRGAAAAKPQGAAALDFDLGDLQPAKPPPSKPKPMPVTMSGMGSIEEEEIPEALDFHIDAPARVQGSMAAIPAPPPSGPTSARGGPAPIETAEPQAPAIPPPPPEFGEADLDHADIATLADFGPPPRGWIQAPSYAIRVFRRKRQLKVELQKARSREDDTRHEELLRLTRIVEALAPSVGPDHAARSLLEPLVKVDEVARSKGVALEEASRRASEDVGSVDRKIAAKQGERERIEADLGVAQQKLHERKEELMRAEAKLKRTEIELRAAHEAARHAAGPDAKFAPPEHALKIKTLESEKQARATEVAPLVPAHDEAAAVVRAHEASLRAVQRDMSQLRDARQKTEQRAAHQVQLRSASVRSAEDTRCRAYADVARAIAAHHADLLSDADRADMAAMRERVRKAAIDGALHDRALHVADADAVTRGRIMIALGVIAVVLLLVFAVRLN